jgi:hypothetical protein
MTTPNTFEEIVALGESDNAPILSWTEILRQYAPRVVFRLLGDMIKDGRHYIVIDCNGFGIYRNQENELINLRAFSSCPVAALAEIITVRYMTVSELASAAVQLNTKNDSNHLAANAINELARRAKENG